MLEEGQIPAVTWLRVPPPLTPSRGTARYLPGRARSQSSSSTHHGTASTPRRSSPAPWPRRAASPVPGQPPQPAATLACPPHRGTRHPPNELLHASILDMGRNAQQGQDRARSQRVKARWCQPRCPVGWPQLAAYRYGGEQAHPGKTDEAAQVPGPEHIPHGCPASLRPVLPAPGCVSG